MSEPTKKSPSLVDPESTNALDQARSAARAFCRHFRYPPRTFKQLEGDPMQPPIVIMKDELPTRIFRWLGHGRGAPYVQVEIRVSTGEVTVFGAMRDREFGPWKAP